MSRGGGPGGQHVNKVSTRVALVLDVEGSPSLTEEAKSRIREGLGRRLTKDGRLRVVCGVHRSQPANRREALARLVELLRRALVPRRERVATRVPRAERERRIAAKRLRARIKRQRVTPGKED